MGTSFAISGLSLKGEWDEANRFLVVNEIDGELSIAGKLLGFNVNINGNVEAGLDNCFRLKMKPLGFIPSFLIPIIFRVARKVNHKFFEALSIDGATIKFDPNRVLADQNRFRVLVQPGSFDLPGEAVVSFRARILTWADRHGGAVAKEVIDMVMTIPDLIQLLIRLMRDERVPADLKLKISLAIAYTISPVDLIPEILLGPLGYADDALAICILIADLVTRIPPELIREHWSGREDVVDLVIRGQALMIKLVPSGILERLVTLFTLKKNSPNNGSPINPG
jgi:uncharacterized membrane protein YkvA (DUF1232 family)